MYCLQKLVEWMSKIKMAMRPIEYSEKKLIEEANLFTQWYLPTKLTKNEIKKVI